MPLNVELDLRSLAERIPVAGLSGMTDKSPPSNCTHSVDHEQEEDSTTVSLMFFWKVIMSSEWGLKRLNGNKDRHPNNVLPTRKRFDFR